MTTPDPTPVSAESDHTWHLTGWNTYSLADATGRVLGSVRDGAGPVSAFVEGKGRIGEYLTVEQAKAAVERVVSYV